MRLSISACDWGDSEGFALCLHQSLKWDIAENIIHLDKYLDIKKLPWVLFELKVMHQFLSGQNDKRRLHADDLPELEK